MKINMPAIAEHETFSANEYVQFTQWGYVDRGQFT